MTVHVALLKVALGALVACGLAMYGLGVWPDAGPLSLMLELVGSGAPVEVGRGAQFLSMLVGAVLVGWAVTLGALISGEGLGVARMARFARLGLVTWFVLDSGTSLWMGFPGNAAGNCVFLVLFLLALRLRPAPAERVEVNT